MKGHSHVGGGEERGKGKGRRGKRGRGTAERDLK